MVVEDFKGAIARRGGTLYYDQASGLVTTGDKEAVSTTGRRLAAAIARELEKRKIGAGLRVTGQLLEEEAGCGPLRSIVGLGAGGSRLSARTLVFNQGKSPDKPWLVIWTDGGSGREPGAAFSFIPPPFGAFILPIASAGAGLALLSHGGKGTGQDARRTAKVVADAIEWAGAAKGSGGAPKWRGAARLPGGGAVPFTREGRLLSLPRTTYIGDGHGD